MSTTGDKAKRSTVAIGSLSIAGFQMPDGSYRMSQTQAAECIGKPEINARRFLDSRGIKALRGEGYTPDTIEVDSPEQERGQTRFNALPLDVVSAYWLWEASKGNQQAIALCYALMAETLERRFDNAFGVERSESDREALLAQRLQADLSALGEAYAEPDELREQVARLEQQLRDAGLEPWQLPPSER
ncbi:hypothetical protein VB780_24820 [Leptolyngbya sp. CCNP1308]|uniref:hypothetical protein n=1 Tax=Leptolyngbya sp. CCNP1308 TaxID=3110255 RepID=UPI002B221060|nr:hypothetical protein [Leptolyngbya sp. CCNP1308]MEA5451823.1 hypothetical protein [Leptolyngbya sp. CCNP1308]